MLRSTPPTPDAPRPSSLHGRSDEAALGGGGSANGEPFHAGAFGSSRARAHNAALDELILRAMDEVGSTSRSVGRVSTAPRAFENTRDVD